MFFKFNALTQSHEPRPVVIPYWLKRYLEEEGIGLGRFVKAWCSGNNDELKSILSEEDIKLYRACQDVFEVYREYNPLAPLMRGCESTGSLTERLLKDPEWVVVAANLQSQGLPPETVLRAIYYEALLGADFAHGFQPTSATSQRLTSNAPLYTLQPALIEDCLTIVAAPAEVPIDMKAFASQCIELLYSSMSFSQIVRTPYMSLYMKAARAKFIPR